MMTKTLLLSFTGILSITCSMSQTVLPLYPDKIPNSIPSSDQERSVKNGVLLISNVSKPSLTVFAPQDQNENKPAVIICPGGGYGVLAFEHEGTEVAQELNEKGIVAFVLKYRLPDDLIMKDKSIGPLQDAQQAIKVVRENAVQWKVDPNKIGIMGFSAGGHLAATAGTHHAKTLTDNLKGTSLRPDFIILVYPVISFKEGIGHMGSRNNLIGTSPTENLIQYYSNELQVDETTAPTFIVHAGDDDVVPVQNSLLFYEALLKHGVETELLIYPRGGHGFGLKNPTTDDLWIERCFDWMKSNQWIK